MSATIYVSGAGGYVGQALVLQLRAAGLHVIGLTRNTPCVRCDDTIVGDLAEMVPDLSGAGGGDTFIHLAAKVHDRSADGEAFMLNTVRCARNVARAIADSPIRRIIHLSSIGARIASESATEARPYGKAKLAAEQAFEEEFRRESDVSLVTLRPPAIYGPGAPGNFAILERFIRHGIPLPLGCADAERDYLFIDNLIDLLMLLCKASEARFARASGRPYEPSDGTPIPTRDLVQQIASLMGRRVRMIAVPISLLRLAGVATGRDDQISGAVCPLLVREQPSLKAAVGWTPRQSLVDGLAQTYKHGKAVD